MCSSFTNFPQFLLYWYTYTSTSKKKIPKFGGHPSIFPKDKSSWKKCWFKPHLQSCVANGGDLALQRVWNCIRPWTSNTRRKPFHWHCQLSTDSTDRDLFPQGLQLSIQGTRKMMNAVELFLRVLRLFSDSFYSLWLKTGYVQVAGSVFAKVFSSVGLCFRSRIDV